MGGFYAQGRERKLVQEQGRERKLSGISSLYKHERGYKDEDIRRK